MSAEETLTKLLVEHGRFDEARAFWQKSDADPEGTYFEDAASYVECELLGTCGCGAPQFLREHMLAVLEMFSEEENRWRFDEEAERALFGPDGNKWFFWYWLAKNDYTEHGGSVPGWLTEEGLWLRDVLRALAAGVVENTEFLKSIGALDAEGK